MESLLGKVTGDSGDGGNAQAAATQAHSALQQAASQLTPSQFHEATSSAMNNLSAANRSKLSQVLTQSGAAAGAGVDPNSTDSNAVSKMLHWVQTNVPGGIPAVLAAVGVAGAAGAVAGTDQGGNVAASAQAAGGNLVQSAQESGGSLFHSVLNAVMPAITDAVSKVGK